MDKPSVQYESVNFSDEEEPAATADIGDLKPDPDGLLTLEKINNICGEINNAEENDFGSEDDIEGDLNQGSGSEFPSPGESNVTFDTASYMCKLCMKSFDEQNIVEAHLIADHDLGEQTALFTCLKSVKKPKRVWRREKDGYFHCMFCHHRSQRSINVREHEKTNHAGMEMPLKNYSCKLCKNKFAIEQIFVHIQEEHKDQSDNLSFIGNNLTEHYTVNIQSQTKSIKLSDSLESLEAAENKGPFRYCQHCSYKTRSVRGLRSHERMQHASDNVKRGQTACKVCGETRNKNSIHVCKKSSKKGRKKSLVKDPEGRYLCADCDYKSKHYASMSTHIKARKHQMQRIRPVVCKKTSEAKMSYTELNSPMKTRSGRKSKPASSGDEASEKSEFIIEKDIASSAMIGMDNGADGENEPSDKTDTQEQSEELFLQLEASNLDLDFLESESDEEITHDDSNDDDWIPTGTAKRKSKDGDSDDSFGRKKRRRKISQSSDDMSKKKTGKDPKSPPPKKTDEGKYMCNFCTFESRYAQSIELHQWRHTGYKPHTCDHCHQGFRSKQRLEHHRCVGQGKGDAPDPAEPEISNQDNGEMDTEETSDKANPETRSQEKEAGNEPQDKTSEKVDSNQAGSENIIQRNSEDNTENQQQQQRNEPSMPQNTNPEKNQGTREKNTAVSVATTLGSPTPIIIEPPHSTDTSHRGDTSPSDCVVTSFTEGRARNRMPLAGSSVPLNISPMLVGGGYPGMMGPRPFMPPPSPIQIAPLNAPGLAGNNNSASMGIPQMYPGGPRPILAQQPPTQVPPPTETSSVTDPSLSDIARSSPIMTSSPSHFGSVVTPSPTSETPPMSLSTSGETTQSEFTSQSVDPDSRISTPSTSPHPPMDFGGIGTHDPNSVTATTTDTEHITTQAIVPENSSVSLTTSQSPQIGGEPILLTGVTAISDVTHQAASGDRPTPVLLTPNIANMADQTITPQPVTTTTPTPELSTATATSPPTTTTTTASTAGGKSINDLHKCILCRVYFEDQAMYRNHMAHHGQTIGTCRVCNQMFRTPLAFMNHLHCSFQCRGIPQMYTNPRGGSRGRSSPRQATPGAIPGRGRGSRGVSPAAGVSLAGAMSSGLTTSPGQHRIPPMSRGSSPMAMGSPRGSMPGRRGRPPLSSYSPQMPVHPQMQFQQRLQMQQQRQQQQQHMMQRGMGQTSPIHPPPRRRNANDKSDVIVID